jgi:hypothetical protein
MRERPPTLQKHLRSIAKAQFVAQAPDNDKKDGIRRICEKVEGSAGAFMKKVFAGCATKCPVSEDGFLALFFCGGRCTMGTIHGALLIRGSFLKSILHE